MIKPGMIKRLEQETAQASRTSGLESMQNRNIHDIRHQLCKLKFIPSTNRCEMPRTCVALSQAHETSNEVVRVPILMGLAVQRERQTLSKLLNNNYTKCSKADKLGYRLDQECRVQMKLQVGIKRVRQKSRLIQGTTIRCNDMKVTFS